MVFAWCASGARSAWSRENPRHRQASPSMEWEVDVARLRGDLDRRGAERGSQLPRFYNRTLRRLLTRDSHLQVYPGFRAHHVTNCVETRVIALEPSADGAPPTIEYDGVADTDGQ
jgi:hypothetical protein